MLPDVFMAKTRISVPADQVPTAYAQVRGNVPETFDVFLGSVAPKGYAWIIPKGPDTANVGLGVRAGCIERFHQRTSSNLL